ncbi:torsin-1A-like [Hydra vulgaris]|uniref:Torsin-1A-like n=1 Tax=Hydra vulgaris TaxID=6087 RepID=A0ABM4DFN9_HYDVU
MNSILKLIFILESLAAVYCFEPFTMFALGSVVTSAFIASVAYLKQKESTSSSTQTTVQKRDKECDEVNFINASLKKHFDKNVFGQDFAVEHIVNACRSHSNNKNPKAPLVMSFHGPTGTGKSYVSKLVAETLFKNGINSKFVHHKIATKEYIDNTQHSLTKYKTELSDFIEKNSKLCERSLFIFEEFNSMPEGLADVLTHFLDYHDKVGDQDYRKHVFIFLSNVGAEMIINNFVNHYKNKKTRETIPLEDIAKLLPTIAYNSPGGFKDSKIISKASIGFYVPFLPLERKHVKQCAEKELRNCNKEVDSITMESVLNDMIYDPNKYFSMQGCKTVQNRVAILC